MLIGVLALQGAFKKHEQMLEKLGIDHLQVRYPHQLDLCTALIIPGGESTTMALQIKEKKLLDPLKNFGKPVFGTCAGMILMAKENLLSMLDIHIDRNAYGRQRHSFQADIQGIPAFFIRAPRITHILSSKIKVLAEYAGEPVLVQQGAHLAASFHPELTDDVRIHKYFIELVLNQGDNRVSTHSLFAFT